MENKTSKVLLTGVGILTGLGLGLAGVAAAQTATSPVTTTGATSVVTTSVTGTPSQPQGHRPLGKDGIVVSVSGTTVIMAEESDEGGATYTVDASGATVTNNGSTVDLSSLTAGEKIFVEGTVSGTTVTATSLSTGPGGPGGGGHRPNDGDGDAGDATTGTPSTATATQ